MTQGGHAKGKKPKESYLVMRIHKGLKAELRQLAALQGRTLSDFVCVELSGPSCSAPTVGTARRRSGRTYFMMRINEETKAKLEKLAARDYRTMTDYIELALMEVAAGRSPQNKPSA